jgi:hypothetical protein
MGRVEDQGLLVVLALPRSSFGVRVFEVGSVVEGEAFCAVPTGLQV